MRLRSSALVAVGVLLLGCPSSYVRTERVAARLEIQSDLSGVQRLTFENVHRVGDDPKVAEKLARICAGDDFELLEAHFDDELQAFAARNVTDFEVVRRGREACDVIATSPFAHAGSQLGEWWRHVDHRVEKRSERFIASLPLDGESGEGPPIEIRYAGLILGHSAETFARSEGALRWPGRYVIAHGIELELLIPAGNGRAEAGLRYELDVDANLAGVVEVHRDGEPEGEATGGGPWLCAPRGDGQAERVLGPLGVEPPVAPWVGRDARSCRAVAAGRFRYVGAVLAALAAGGDYAVSVAEDRLAVELVPGAEHAVAIALRYAGPVFGHNAEEYARDSGRLAWSADYVARYGLRVELGTP